MNSTRPRHLRRNFILLLTDYTLFGMAISLMGNTTVVPDLVNRLTSSDVLVGLSGSLYQFAWLMPQLLFAQIINRSARRMPYMSRTVLPFRLSLGIMSAVIFFSSADNRSGILIAFLTGYAFFALGDGLVTIVWADFLGSAIPERWRGVLFGLGQTGVAFSVLGTREIIRFMLGPSGPPFPQNYGLMFGISTFIFVVAAIALTLVAEEEHPVPLEPGPPMRQYLAYLGRVLRDDRDFRRLTIVRLLLDLSMMGVPFYVIFGEHELKLRREALVGDTLLIMTIGTTIASIVMGWLSRRSGSRAVIRSSGVASILHPALALLSLTLGQPSLYLAFLTVGFVNAVVAPGYFDWIITHAPPDRRPIYVGLANTISAVSHLAPFLGGFILNLTSYSVLFVVSIVFAVTGLISTALLSEPRRRTAASTYAIGQEEQSADIPQGA